jgi:hypothetical protein
MISGTHATYIISLLQTHYKCLFAVQILPTVSQSIPSPYPLCTLKPLRLSNLKHNTQTLILFHFLITVVRTIIYRTMVL